MTSVLKAVFKFALFLAVLVGGFGLVMKLFFVDLAQVGFDTMLPTISNGDQVVMWRGAPKNPKLGDILICENPMQIGSFVVGRVAAKGGMEIKTERGTLFIAGDSVNVDWHGQATYIGPNGHTHEMSVGTEELSHRDHVIWVKRGREQRIRATTVPAGKVFLLGDNRSLEYEDSRAHGSVDPSTCLGTVFMRWAPSKGPNALEHGWLQFLD